MGFSIGGLLKGALGGFLAGGPVGAVLGGAAGAAGVFTPPTPPRIPQSFFRPSQVGPTVTRIGLAGQIITRGVVGVLTVLELLKLSRQSTGRPASVQKVVDAIRVCGISQAASIFGLSETEICQIAIAKRRRRARGISAVDLRRTRSTIRKVHNIAHDLKALSPAVRRHHR